jgi:hypothetical protein
MKDLSSMDGSAAAPASPERQILTQRSELRSSVSALRDDALLSPLISIGRNGLGGHQVVRPPGALRLHSALNDLNLSGWVINSESQGKPQDVHEPILITNQDILLAGFAEWHAAVCAGQGEIVCIEFALNDDEALRLILALHRPRAEWNDFIRIELALEQESIFSRRLSPTGLPAASTRLWQICQKLSTLMCVKRLPTLPGSLLELLAM